MSIKLTTQDAWKDYAYYSKYHPDNTKRPPFKLEDEKIEKPPPKVSFSQVERMEGAWGHSLCCEQGTGPMDSNTRMMKRGITPKARRDAEPPARATSRRARHPHSFARDAGWAEGRRAGRVRREGAVAHVHGHVRGLVD